MALNDDTFKLKYEELKRDKPMPFTLPPQWEGPVDYQTMARDGAIHSGQEDISTSDSESEHTVHAGLEEVGVVYVEHFSSSENLKVMDACMHEDSKKSVYIANYFIKACLLTIPKGILDFLQWLLEAL